MKKYVQQTQLESYRKFGLRIHSCVAVLISDNVIDDSIAHSIVMRIKNKIPKELLCAIERINFGLYKFGRRGIASKYIDGTIFVHIGPETTIEKTLQAITHELSHALEFSFRQHLSDFKLKQEFISKRRRLFDLLENEYKDIKKFNNRNLDYDGELDTYLANNIGLDKLERYTLKMFVSPYSATCYSEYIAEGFENYLLGDHKTLRSLSPVLYKKIEEMIEGKVKSASQRKNIVF